jgi:hypothetical protein
MRARTRLCLAIAALTLAGCDPIWRVSVQVRDPSSRPVANAAVMFACRAESGQAPSGWIERTDKDGKAVLGGLGTSIPAGCAVAVARPGYATRSTTFETMCGSTPLADCNRVREESVVLVPLASPSPAPR